MKKSLNDMTPQELIQSFIPTVGALIKAEVQTMAIVIEAKTKAIVKESEERIRKDMATKQDIQRLETEIKKLEQKIDGKILIHESRLEKLENPHSVVVKN